MSQRLQVVGSRSGHMVAVEEERELVLLRREAVVEAVLGGLGVLAALLQRQQEEIQPFKARLMETD